MVNFSLKPLLVPLMHPDSTPFIHLRTHTEYSLIDSLMTVDNLVETAKNNGMPALAITDHVNLFATIKFYQAAIQSGVKPIIGADVWIENAKDTKRPFLLTLLCQNKNGYKNLIKLISKGYFEGQKDGKPLLQYEWLKQHHTGLIALSGAQNGDVGQALVDRQWDLAEQRLKNWKSFFEDRFYIALSRTQHESEKYYVSPAITLAKTHKVPVVATNDVCFISEDDFEAHETRVCIHASYILNDPNRPKKYTTKQYFRTTQEMQTLFADIPEALQNTVEIAKRCNVMLELNKTFLPAFPVPEAMSAEDYLSQKSLTGLKQRFTQISLSPEKHAEYIQRLENELSVINSMGFAGYFLIVADFIQWAKANHIAVGPGRGSGAGSLVAFALEITGLDPIAYELLFERFLNPERISMPDFDIDFCMDNRDRVIEYVSQKYSRSSVSQIITFGTMAAKAVIRDVGRVLGHPYGFVDRIAKLIPFELGITLDQALVQEESLKKLYDDDEEIKNLIDLAKKLEGLVRNAGKHAGGVVIAPSPLTDFSALYCEDHHSPIVTQFDKDDIETVGLVKFDFLGLRTLTIIDWTLKTVNEKRQLQNLPPIKIETIVLDNKETFDALKACSTTAVFQLESRGMKDLVKRVQPDCFEEIIALVALYRPGPLQSGMVDDFIDRKHGRAPITYLHPSLEIILKPTYGVILYQEQVMQIAQLLANYTLGEADILRRAMGKKKPEEMAKQSAKFIAGANKINIDSALAEQIFNLMEKFAGYGFNKSHSAAYALLTYQTAWLKTHYPAEFMAAVLSSDMDKTDKVVRFFQECKALGLKVLPPDINRSAYYFTVNENNDILYGLGAVKGVGFAAVENIIHQRQKKSFIDLFDFCSRVDLRKVNKRSIEALIQAGALDELGPHRATLLATLEKAMQYAEQTTQTTHFGMQDMFSQKVNSIPTLWVNTEKWSNIEQMSYEKIQLGLYFSGHPLDAYQAELSHLTTTNIQDLKLESEQAISIAGLISQVRFTYSKRNQPIAFITLEDLTGSIDVAIFAEALEASREWIVKDKVVVVEGSVQMDQFTGGFRISTKRLIALEKAREQRIRSIRVQISQEKSPQLTPDVLKNALKQYLGGSCPIWIEYLLANSTTKIPLGSKWHICPSDLLLQALRKLTSDEAVICQY